MKTSGENSTRPESEIFFKHETKKRTGVHTIAPIQKIKRRNKVIRKLGGSVMRRGVLFCFLLIGLVFQLMATEVDAYFFTFAETEHNEVVSNWGLQAGVGGYVFDGQFGLTGAFDFRNFMIGDFQPHNIHASKWPGPLEDFYYLLDYGYAWYEGEKLIASAGYQNLEKGLGESYKLWLAPNSGSYPSVSLLYKPFGDVFTVDFNMLFLRNEILDYSLSDIERVQTAKTLYYRTYSLNLFDGFRFGFSDAILFFGRSLDFMYMLSPAPFQTMQEIRCNQTGPWESDAVNDNGFMGVFLELDNDFFRLFGEVMVDDFFPEQLFDPSKKTEGHLQKIAWDLGGAINIGERSRIGAEFAGATRYTFQASAHSSTVPPYAYTHYDEEQWRDLPVEYNMLGYLYGENSASVDVFYKFNEENWNAQAHYEFVCFGEREPFREEKNTGSGFVWLEDPVLEMQHKLKFNFGVDFVWDTHLDLDITVGRVINKKLFEGFNDYILEFSVGATKYIPMMQFVKFGIPRGQGR